MKRRKASKASMTSVLMRVHGETQQQAEARLQASRRNAWLMSATPAEIEAERIATGDETVTATAGRGSGTGSTAQPR
jgi:hypothetical protein